VRRYERNFPRVLCEESSFHSVIVT
jgi:hypothetical protein